MGLSREGVMRLPPGYKTFVLEGHPMLGNNKEEFFLARRGFGEVDAYFSSEISEAIEECLKKYPDKKIRILDLGGGTGSRAVIDIGNEYGTRVTAINIDIAHDVERGKEACRVQGDATCLPFVDSSIDIVYSRQLLPFLRRFSSEHKQQVHKLLTETVRVLAPGGTAFLDDEEELSGPDLGKKREELQKEFGIILEVHESALEKEVRNFPNFWEKKIRRERFLVMRKQS